VTIGTTILPASCSELPHVDVSDEIQRVTICDLDASKVLKQIEKEFLNKQSREIFSLIIV
jgi:hypothetical protein